ncbi:hypothetical protein C8R45DRAFT_944032 [Mycena sanguinolenta]|nr:hypothetical protein C8R45DRAFT_944032 [Mycena sanguinolenta]
MYGWKRPEKMWKAESTKVETFRKIGRVAGQRIRLSPSFPSSRIYFHSPLRNRTTRRVPPGNDYHPTVALLQRFAHPRSIQRIRYKQFCNAGREAINPPLVMWLALQACDIRASFEPQQRFLRPAFPPSSQQGFSPLKQFPPPSPHDRPAKESQLHRPQCCAHNVGATRTNTPPTRHMVLSFLRVVKFGPEVLEGCVHFSRIWIYSKIRRIPFLRFFSGGGPVWTIGDSESSSADRRKGTSRFELDLELGSKQGRQARVMLKMNFRKSKTCATPSPFLKDSTNFFTTTWLWACWRIRALDKAAWYGPDAMPSVFLLPVRWITTNRESCVTVASSCARNRNGHDLMRKHHSLFTRDNSATRTRKDRNRVQLLMNSEITALHAPVQVKGPTAPDSALDLEYMEAQEQEVSQLAFKPTRQPLQSPLMLGRLEKSSRSKSSRPQLISN